MMLSRFKELKTPKLLTLFRIAQSLRNPYARAPHFNVTRRNWGSQAAIHANRITEVVACQPVCTTREQKVAAEDSIPMNRGENYFILQVRYLRKLGVGIKEQ